MRRRRAAAGLGILTALLLVAAWVLRDEVLYGEWMYRVTFFTRDSAEGVFLAVWESNGTAWQYIGPHGEWTGQAHDERTAFLAIPGLTADDYEWFAEQEGKVSYERFRLRRWDWTLTSDFDEAWTQDEDITAEKFRAAVGWD